MRKRAGTPKTATALQPQSPISERVLDIGFYRTVYGNTAHLSDADLVKLINAGRLSMEKGLNAAEFARYVLLNKLLPNDFDLFGYRVQHTELWGFNRADWEVIAHYLNNDSSTEKGWTRPFDDNFYCELYQISADKEFLRSHRRAYPDLYGSLDEALVRNGWRTRDWVQAFDHQSYMVYNTLTERLRNPTQAVVHFIEHGWRERLAISADREFDPAYYADLVGNLTQMSPDEAYRTWVEFGLAAGVPANEKGFLSALRLDLPGYPEGFDWRAYVDERLNTGLGTQGIGHTLNRWNALEHLVEHGVLEEGPPLPARTDTLQTLFLAAGERFANMGREEEATRCYEHGLLYSNPPIRLLQHAADQALRQKRYARALVLYRHVRAISEPGFWTWCNGAEAALAIGELQEATEWVFAGLAQNPRSSLLQSVLLRIQKIRFDHAVSRHIGALRAGRLETGIGPALDAILDLFLAVHRISFGEAGPLSRERKDGPLRVVILANKDLPQCTFYRVDLKVEQFAAVGGVNLQIFDRSEDEAFRSAATTADVALFYRLASNTEVLRSIAACRAAGVITVYEVDDFVFDPTAFPDPLSAYNGAVTAEEHFALRAGVALVQHAAASCDAAVASTERLAGRLRDVVRSGTALVHRNGLSNALAAFARTSVPRRPLPDDKTITLFYGSGTRAHGADFQDLLVPALTRLMAEHPEIRFVACGHVDATDLALRFPSRVECVPAVADRDAYLSQLLAVDINLAVLQKGIFNDCKSEIKWLEAAAFCVPSVVSDVEGFRETLNDGVHIVRVASNPGAWHAALHALVMDPARRQAIGIAARDRALELYDLGVLGRTLVEGLGQLAYPSASSAPSERKRRAATTTTPLTVPAQPRRPRILLANVFFPPQAIGGATRVVRDQAAALLAHYADRYEIGILCGNDEESAPYRIEAYAWRGAPVWSISCPHREHMDWLPFDPLMAPPVDAVLDRFKPDLVHAHCIQRLTATTLEKVATRNIPYLITAHDAWWVSDHQFLVDGQDRVQMPWDAEEFETAYNPHTRAGSWSRRLRLRNILNSAAAVTTVSETFAMIYRRAGVSKTIAVPNGLPELPPIQLIKSDPGHVRLAYLGGVMAHKGYFLIRQALGRGQFNKLSLLVLDHAMKPGEERRELWGTTPIRITGRVPQDRVGELYGEFDVLCAPSLWPESYGLVAHEALHYGKWVLASSRGAIGDYVIPGQNGWLIDVADPTALPRVLAEIEQNPIRYTTSPASQPNSRTIAQQVDDMVKIYEEITRKERRSNKSKQQALQVYKY